MATVREILAKLNIEVEDKELDGFNDKLSNVSKGMGEFAKKAAKAAAVATGALVVGLSAVAVKSAQAAHQIADQANMVGLSAEKYQQWAFAAGRAGVEQGAFIGLMKRTNELIGAANDPTTSQAKAFNELGISLTNSNGSARDAVDVINELKDAYNSGDTEKYAKVSQLLGGQLQDNAALFSLNNEELGKLLETGQKQAISQESIEASIKFNEALEDIRTILFKAGTVLVQVVQPAVERVRDAFLTMSGQASGAFDQEQIALWALDVEFYTLVAIEKLANVVTFIKKWKDEILLVLQAIGAAFAIKFAVDVAMAGVAVANMASAAASSIATMWASIAPTLAAWLAATWAQVAAMWAVLAPILAIAAPIIIIAGVIIGLVWLIIEKWGYISIFLDDLWNGIKEMILNVMKVISKGITSAANTIKNIFTSVKDSIINSFKSALNFVTGVINKVKNAGSSIKEFFTGGGGDDDSPRRASSRNRGASTRDLSIEARTQVGDIYVQGSNNPSETAKRVRGALADNSANQSAVNALNTGMATS